LRSYLIVDDNVAFAENVAEILHDLGDVDVELADSGLAALRRVEKRRFDALVSDMRMPHMSGAELVHRVRHIDPGLPAVVVTAFTGADDLSAARREGVLAVLPKPVPVALLVGTLSRARRDGMIALVEDDTVLADSLSEALRQRGFTVVTARSAMDFDRLGGLQPFTAVVDLRGARQEQETLTALAERFPGLPMLAVTDGEVPPSSSMVFKRPFDMAALVEAVEAQYRLRGA